MTKCLQENDIKDRWLTRVNGLMDSADNFSEVYNMMGQRGENTRQAKAISLW